MTNPLVSPRAAFAHADFRAFQVGRFLTTLAAQMQSVAVGWEVFKLTHAPLALGYVGLVQFLPAAGLSMFTGTVADRYDRRRIVLVCETAFVACALFLSLRSASRSPAVGPIYLTLFLFGVARAFGNPASQALMPNLVPKEHFASAVAWSSSIWEIAAIAGPAVGGLCIVRGPLTAYGACALLYGAAMIAFSRIGVRSVERVKDARAFATLVAGIRYVWEKKIILGSISLDLFAVLFGGATALLPVYADEILHAGPLGFGALRSAPAIGAAATAIVVAYRPLKRRAGLVMFVCVGLFGVATIVFALSRNFVLSLLALAVLGASDMVSVVVRQTLVQLRTPGVMRGRVSAVNMVFIGASNELGEMESGVTAQWLGTVPAVALGGVGACIIVVLWAFLFPQLRKVDRLEGDNP